MKIKIENDNKERLGITIKIKSDWDYFILIGVLMPFVLKSITAFSVGVDYLIHDLSWLINKLF